MDKQILELLGQAGSPSSINGHFVSIYKQFVKKFCFKRPCFPGHQDGIQFAIHICCTKTGSPE